MTSLVLDTSAAIKLRDNDPDVRRRILPFTGDIILSSMTLAELQAGVREEHAVSRGAALAVMLDALVVRPFGAREAEIYGDIVRALGFSRVKVLDRLIAAQALALGLPLATYNGADFRDIPDLKLLEW